MTIAIPGHDDVEPRTAWFTRARFGMFIHSGIYAAAARHEWVRLYLDEGW
ncbi:MAG TPA: alpha-L-fucosidase [Rugosimonospora sp.]